MVRGQEIGFFEHLLQILNGRNQDVVFRVGMHGHWRQITGADFLADVDLAAEAFSRHSALPRERGAEVRSEATSYCAVVYAVAAALLGWRVAFGAAARGETPVLPSECEQHLGHHRFARHGAWKLQRWVAPGEAMGSILFTESDLASNETSFDSLTQVSQRFLQVREIYESRALRGRIRFLALTPPSSAWFHVFWMASVLENGVCGFPDASSDWETNLRVLRPTLVATGGKDVAMISEFVEQVSSRSRLLWKAERALRGVGLLKTPLMREAFEDLKTVVLDSTSSSHEQEGLLREAGLKVLRLKSPLRNPLSTALQPTW